MGFLKKILTALGAFLLIFWGGAGTQSKSLMMQGGGFILFLIGLVVLYIFVKMAWRAMGCLPSFLIFSGIITFIIYAIGGFNNGITGVIPTLKSFLGQSENQTTPSMMTIDENLEGMDAVEEGIIENGELNDIPQLRQPSPKVQSSRTMEQFVQNFGGKRQKTQRPASPQDYPSIVGPVRVVNGDTLMMDGYYIRLFGIDAPEADQTCANKMGRAYHCGRVAATWLRDWLMDNSVECHIMQQDKRGNMVGVCSLGQYDIGAAMVNSGWAIAYEKYSDIYVPYQEQAMSRRDGLWQGKFYSPEDWRKMKAKKPNIKITKPKKERKSMLGF